MTQTDTQLLKAAGRLPRLDLSDLESSLVIPTEDELRSLEDRHCGTPDFADDEIASFDDPDKLAALLSLPNAREAELLIKNMSKMIEVAATGDGSWPAACHAIFPRHHAVTYFVEQDTWQDRWRRPTQQDEIQELYETRVWGSREFVFDTYLGKPMLDVANWLCDEACRRIGIVWIPVHTGPDGVHNVHIKGERIPGSVIGWGEFPNGRCDDHVLIRLDTSSGYRPGLHSFCWLILHERGHTLDLRHQRGPDGTASHSIMSYNNVTPFVGFYTGDPVRGDRRPDVSLPILHRSFGGEPVPVTPTGPIDPGPDTDTPSELPQNIKVVVDGTTAMEWHQ